MATVFGEVADAYDEIRPGYPAALAEAIGAYAGAVPHVVELGAGTGKGTEILAGLGARLTCVEPDPRMAAVLRAKFPDAEVVVSTFEQWSAPPGGVPLIACGLAWHWMDAASRNQRAHDALRPGGVLAVFAHHYGFADPHQAAALDAAYREGGDHTGVRNTRDWIIADIVDSGLWKDLEVQRFTRVNDLSTEEYLRLQQTYSTHRFRAPDEQEQLLAGLRAAIDGFGGVVHQDLRTLLLLARRP